MKSQNRLRKRSDFLKLRNNGKFSRARGVSLKFRKREEDSGLGRKYLRIGVTASRKVGNAVMRNRAKRRLRAVNRMLDIYSIRENFDVNLIASKTTNTMNWDDLLRSARYLYKSNGILRQKSDRVSRV